MKVNISIRMLHNQKVVSATKMLNNYSLYYLGWFCFGRFVRIGRAACGEGP